MSNLTYCQPSPSTAPAPAYFSSSYAFTIQHPDRLLTPPAELTYFFLRGVKMSRRENLLPIHYGLKRLEELPLSLRLIREIHAKLMAGVRGQNQMPGEFRKTQNWIGPAGANLASATFVPPPVPEMKEALDKFEKFLHDESLPVLIHAGLAHAQFESIHPFLDGNGRVGRLLMITLLLCQRKVLHRPLLYLSHYLKVHRAEYYDRLMAIRDEANWEGWLNVRAAISLLEPICPKATCLNQSNCFLQAAWYGRLFCPKPRRLVFDLCSTRALHKKSFFGHQVQDWQRLRRLV